MSRGDLLIVAERAAELVPRAKLRALIGDMVRVEAPRAARSSARSLLDEVRRFQGAALRGEYYQSFNVDSKNFMWKSAGTEAFIAELDRLMRKCVRAAEKAPRAPARETFETLFGLLRHVDECHDDVVFFADEGGSSQFGIDWRAVLSAYFRSLVEGASAEEYARGGSGDLRLRGVRATTPHGCGPAAPAGSHAETVTRASGENPAVTPRPRGPAPTRRVRR